MLFRQPPGTGNRLPESVCIVSPLCEINLYTQLLTAVEEKLRFLGGVPKTAHDILCAAYEQPCPMPNCEVQIPVGVSMQNLWFGYANHVFLPVALFTFVSRSYIYV
jgi:hypothetical protein